MYYDYFEGADLIASHKIPVDIFILNMYFYCF